MITASIAYLVITLHSGFASMIGDNFDFSLDAISAESSIFSGEDLTVEMSKIEGILEIGSTRLVLDVEADSFALTISSELIFSPLRLTLSDLDWIDNPAGQIVGITSAADHPTTDRGGAAYDLGISFSGHSVTIDIQTLMTPSNPPVPGEPLGFFYPNLGGDTFAFEIETSDSIPEPSTNILYAMAAISTLTYSVFKKNSMNYC